MPILKKVSRRQGAKALHYFKGTVPELESISAKRARKLFSSSIVNKKHNQRFFNELNDLFRAKLIKKAKQLLANGEKTGTVFLNIPSFEEIPFKISVFPSGRILVSQQPFIHSVTNPTSFAGEGVTDSFDALKRIVSGGFLGRSGPNARLIPKEALLNGGGLPYPSYASEFESTKGDTYRIGLMAPAQDFFVSRAKPSQLLCVMVFLRGGKEELAKKKAFYRKELKGVPLKFVSNGSM